MASAHEPATERRHELWVDNLRVAVIAGVIVLHTATGYVVDFAGVGLGLWLKFVLVAALAVPVCFAVGYGLTRLPGVSKVL